MIDLRLLRENPDAVRASQRARGDDESLVDQALDADKRYRAALTSFEKQRAEQKAFGASVAKAKGDEKKALVEQAQKLAAAVKQAQADADAAQAEFTDIVASFANIVEPEAPVGGEEDYTVVREVGKPRDFAAEGLEPLPHWDLGTALDIIDTERGAKVSGSRFYYLKGLGARLELALLLCAVDRAVEAGFTPMITPTLVSPGVMNGTGFLGRHADAVYHLEADDLYLTGTSEVALAGYHMDEILDLSDGPKMYTGWSACYRPEAGSAGKDTRGIFRVHQFHKVEMFVYAHIEDAHDLHLRLLSYEEALLQAVGLPYRVIDTAAGDLGSSAARKYDCEAWIPTQNRYREMTSTSNCTQFQARRLNIREKDPNGDGNRPVATLNGTFATTRWICAILENFQQADGSVIIPEVLRPYMGGADVIRPVAAPVSR